MVEFVLAFMLNFGIDCTDHDTMCTVQNQGSEGIIVQVCHLGSAGNFLPSTEFFVNGRRAVKAESVSCAET